MISKKGFSVSKQHHAKGSGSQFRKISGEMLHKLGTACVLQQSVQFKAVQCCQVYYNYHFCGCKINNFKDNVKLAERAFSTIQQHHELQPL